MRDKISGYLSYILTNKLIWLGVGVALVVWVKITNVKRSKDDFVPSLIVQVAKMHPTDNTYEFFGDGFVRSSKELYVKAEIDTVVEKILVKAGTKVRKGQVVIELEKRVSDENIASTEAAYLNARKRLRVVQQLYKKGLESESAFYEAMANLKSMEANFNTARISARHVTAPFDGIVSVVYVDRGERIERGKTTLFYLIGTDAALTIKSTISGKYLPFVKKGDIIEVVGDHNTVLGNAKVIEVPDVLDFATGSVTITVAITNFKALIGDVLSLRFAKKIPDTVKLDYKQLVIHKDKISVLLIKDGEVIAAPVKIIAENNDGTLLIQGVNEGDSMIVKGQKLVAIGDKVDSFIIKELSNG